MPGFDLFDIGGSICKFIQWCCWSFCNWACDIINEMLATVSGQNMNIFTLPLGGEELGSIYTAAANVNTNVSMQIAYALLGLFVALELWDVAKGMRAGQTRLGGADQLIACLIKIMIVKLLIDNSQAICQVVYDLTCNISRGIETFATVGGGTDAAMPTDKFLTVIETASHDQIGLFLFMCLVMIVSVVVVFAAVIFVQVIALTRFIEIFAAVAFAALPIVAFLNQHIKQVGIGFMKVYIAVCLQGPVLVLLLKFVMPLFGALATILTNMISGGDSTVLQTILSGAAPLALCFAIVVAVQHSRNYANNVVGGA